VPFVRKTVLKKRPFIPAHEKTLEKSPSEQVNLDDNYGKHTFMLKQKPTQRPVRLCGARPVQVFAQYSPSLSFCNITAGFTLLFIALSQRNKANRRFIM
jgi:hypothetical protein